MALVNIKRTTLSRCMSPKLDREEHRLAPFVPGLVPEGTAEETFTGPISGIPRYFVGKTMRAEVEMTDAATVVIIIEGRGHPSLGWIEVARLTTSGAHPVAALSELRATVRGNVGTVSVRLCAPL